jgi:hypothetical protein
MSGAIDSTLGAISSGTVHSRVGACDPRGLFAKRILHGDSHRALAIASLINSFNSYATAKKFCCIADGSDYQNEKARDLPTTVEPEEAQGDSAMPGISGLELQSQLAAKGCSIPIIFISCSTEHFSSSITPLRIPNFDVSRGFLADLLD